MAVKRGTKIQPKSITMARNVWTKWKDLSNIFIS